MLSTNAFSSNPILHPSFSIRNLLVNSYLLIPADLHALLSVLLTPMKRLLLISARRGSAIAVTLPVLTIYSVVI